VGVGACKVRGTEGCWYGRVADWMVGRWVDGWDWMGGWMDEDGWVGLDGWGDGWGEVDG